MKKTMKYSLFFILVIFVFLVGVKTTAVTAEAANKVEGNVTVSDATTTKSKSASKLKVTAKQSTKAIKLSWTKISGSAGYRIYYKSGDSWKKYKDTTATTYTIKNLKAGKKYTFKVAALVKKNGKVTVGTQSDSFATATKPATPSLNVTSTSAGKATLTWTNVSGETGYHVYFSTKKDSGYKKYSSPKANTTKITVTALTGGKTYYFRVGAYIKTSSGNVNGGYKTVSVKVKSSTSNKLTDAKAKELWKTANTVYCNWYVTREHTGYLDTSTKYYINPNTKNHYYKVKHSSITSVAELRAYLKGYFNDKICDNIVRHYVDYKGELYVASTGIGADGSEIVDVTVQSQNSSEAVLRLKIYSMRDKGYIYRTQNMSCVNGKWIFVDSFMCDY